MPVASLWGTAPKRARERAAFKKPKKGPQTRVLKELTPAMSSTYGQRGKILLTSCSEYLTKHVCVCLAGERCEQAF